MRGPRFRLRARPFDWQKLVFAHGWVYLSPYEWDDATRTLCRPLRLASGKSVRARITVRSARGARTVYAVTEPACAVTARDRKLLRESIRRILQLDADFAEFQAVCKGHPLLGFVHRRKCGGLLRGASAFEDAVKTVCTTNCDWRNTKRMCDRLCSLDEGNFPLPEQVVALSEAELAARTSCGYRARTIRQIAKLTAAGQLPLDEWARKGDFARIRASLADVWGVGPYAINHILVLLGDYSVIPVDSEILSYLRNVHFGGKEVPEREAVKPYEHFGRFAFLAFKFGRMSRRFNYINK